MKISFHAYPISIAACAALAAAGLIAVVIVPELNDIRELQQRINTHRHSLEMQYEQGKKIRTSIEEYDDVKNDIPLVSSSVMTLGEELAFITALEEFAARHETQLVIHLDTSQSTAAPDTAAASQFRRVLLRLELQGTAPRLLHLLEDLESYPGYINILQLSLSSQLKSVPREGANADGLSPLLSASLTAATYWKEPAKL